MQFISGVLAMSVVIFFRFKSLHSFVKMEIIRRSWLVVPQNWSTPQMNHIVELWVYFLFQILWREWWQVQVYVLLGNQLFRGWRLLYTTRRYGCVLGIPGRRSHHSSERQAAGVFATVRVLRGACARTVRGSRRHHRVAGNGHLPQLYRCVEKSRQVADLDDWPAGTRHACQNRQRMYDPVKWRLMAPIHTPRRSCGLVQQVWI